MRYFTSDLHLGSSLINKYAHRPFSSAQEAVEKLTDNICQTCDCFDSLIHVGDFMLSGADRHGSEEDRGLDMTLRDYLSDINTRVTLLSGNHDDGHNCEADCKSMVLDLNQNYRNVYAIDYRKFGQTSLKNLLESYYIQDVIFAPNLMSTQSDAGMRALGSQCGLHFK